LLKAGSGNQRLAHQKEARGTEKVALAVLSDYFTHPAEGFISSDGHGQANDACRVFARQFLEDARRRLAHSRQPDRPVVPGVADVPHEAATA